MESKVEDNINITALDEEEIMSKLKSNGLRITEQRKIILDIVCNEDYTCSKEIYYLAHKKDSSIGVATVYRMINVLEDIGAITKNNIQKKCSGRCCDMKEGCTVITGQSNQIALTGEDVEEALKYIMRKKGYNNIEEISNILIGG